MKLGAQFVEKSKSLHSTSIVYNCILMFSFRLVSLILPKFLNHVFYINFVSMILNLVMEPYFLRNSKNMIIRTTICLKDETGNISRFEGLFVINFW